MTIEQYNNDLITALCEITGASVQLARASSKFELLLSTGSKVVVRFNKDIKIVDRQSHDVYPKVAKLVGLPSDTLKATRLKATRLHVLFATGELPEVRVRYGLIPESSDGEANE